MSDVAKLTARVVVDADKVARHVGSKKKRVLFKTGAYAAKSIQRSMRYGTKASKPGKPPTARKNTKKGPLLRKLTRFAVDESKGSVVAGPLLVVGEGATGKTVPQVLNEGGSVSARLIQKTSFVAGEYGPIRTTGAGQFVRTLLTSDDMASRAGRLTIEENARRENSIKPIIAARPFTAPAYTDGGKKFAELLEKEKL